MDSDAKTSLLSRLTSATSSESQPEVSPQQPDEGEARKPSPKPSKQINMVAREVPVNVTGFHPGKTAGQREPFSEEATSALVHEKGGVIQLTADVARGQLLLLTNLESKQGVVAQVKRTYQPMNRCVELEFAEPAPRFWGTKFSAATAMLPKDAKDAEAAALLSAEGTADDSAEPLPPPSAEDVQALKRDVKALTEKVPESAETERPLPVEPISAAVETQFIPAEPPQSPKPSCDFAVPLPKPRPFRAKGRFTPGAALRITLLTAAVLLAALGVAWYMRWIPWKSATMNPSAGVLAVGANVSTSVPTKVQKPGTQHSEPINMNDTNVPRDERASPVTPSHEAESATSPIASGGNASNGSRARPAHDKTSPSRTLAAQHAVLRPTTKTTSAPIVASPGDGVVVPPRLIKSVKAVASLDALRDFETGNVVIDAVVDTDGEVHFITVIAGPPSLRAPAVAAVKQYRYEPATRNGQPVPEHVHITVRFSFES